MGLPVILSRTECAPADLQSITARRISPPGIWMVLTVALLLCWPMFYNGFPLVFSDTGTYIASGIERFVPLDRPIYYGSLLGMTSVAWGLSGMVFLQAICCAYVSLMFVSWIAPGVPGGRMVVALASVVVFTPVAWLCSWLMPDIFGGIMVVTTLLLLFAFDRLARARWVALGGILLICLLVHTGNVILFALLALGFCAVGWILRVRPSRAGGSLLVIVGCLSVFLGMLPNAISHGRWTINPGSQAFLAARLVGDGVMQPFLDRHCPNEPELPLCDHRRDLVGMSNNQFLWNEPALADVAGAWSRRAEVFRSLNSRVILENWDDVALRAAVNTWELLQRTALGDDPLAHNLRAFNRSGLSVNDRIAEYFPGDYARFHASRQQTERLHLEVINPMHEAWTWFSYLILLLTGVLAYRQNRPVLLVVAICIAVALLGNALVHGALSGVYTRYQVKVTWLVTLFALPASAWLIGHGVGMRKSRSPV